MALIVRLICVVLFVSSCSMPQTHGSSSVPKNGDFIVVSPDATYQASKILLFDPVTLKSETLLGGESGDVFIKAVGDRVYLFNRQKGRSSFSYLTRNQEGQFVRSIEIQTPMTDQADPVDIVRSNDGQLTLAMWTHRDVVRIDEASPSDAFSLSSKEPWGLDDNNQKQMLRPAFFLNHSSSNAPLGLIDSKEVIHVVHQNIDNQWKAQGDGAVLSISSQSSTWSSIPISNPVSLLNTSKGYLLAGVCYSSMGTQCKSGLYKFNSLLDHQQGSLVAFDSSEWQPNGGVFEGFDESHVFACGRPLRSENSGQPHLLKLSTSTGRVIDQVRLPSSLCGGSTYLQSPSGEKLLYLGITVPGKGGQFLVYDQSMRQVNSLELEDSIGSFIVYNK